MHTYKHIQAGIHAGMHTHRYIYIYTHIPTIIHTHTNIQAGIHTGRLTDNHTHTGTHIERQAHTHTSHTVTYTLIHLYIHTVIPPCTQSYIFMGIHIVIGRTHTYTHIEAGWHIGNHTNIHPPYIHNAHTYANMQAHIRTGGQSYINTGRRTFA